MPHAFFRTTASFEEGNVAKWQKLEPEFEEVSEPSQLSEPSPKDKVHCVVTAISRKARLIVVWDVLGFPIANLSLLSQPFLTLSMTSGPSPSYVHVP